MQGENLKYKVKLYLHKTLLMCLRDIKDICINKRMLNFPCIWSLIRLIIEYGISKKTNCTVQKYYKYFTCSVQMCHQICDIEYRYII
jgi:hypothetical protein